jgi:hypothetical protein
MVSCITADKLTDPPNCRILNNHIHHIGIIQTSAIAVVAHCCDILHNEISDVPYSGICYAPFTGSMYGGKSSCIEHNIVSRAMQVLNDGAAIYVTFTVDGIIRSNIVRDIQQGSETDSIRNAIYLDEHTEGWEVEGNLVINCSHPTLNHMACRNHIRNNIFISDTFLKVNIIRCRDYTVDHNIMYSKGKLIFAGNPDAIINFCSNILFSETVEYEEYHINDKYKHYETSALRIFDGSVEADPLFVDIDNGNYSIKPGSPVYGLGISEIDVSKAGIEQVKQY